MQAQRWLRLSNTSQAFEGDADDDAVVARPSGLGLGAKQMTSHKVRLG
jgi:hypothetical protein